ncbi:type II toxin-antitoxin system Phd/YefM family antitoxin [Lacticaseibacillus mingshuiensis]|uniref:Antitoxin n=1 Tax=Lacticaseibacillus mingshuiensis TaxID=2799574 RepID=A0ABW4CGL4_9LACO|nr:type II toxin-antitoxin system Phd/YefM family antitoxin [Lacticaseibacillus mingshuiensis]
MNAVSWYSFRHNLKAYRKQVIEDAELLIVTAKHPEDNLVVMSQQEYDLLKETSYLLSSPENAKALRKSIRQATDEAN